MTSEARNIDQGEIAKFNELASRWWDRNSEFKPLHDINPLRANYIDRHAPVAGKRRCDRLANICQEKAAPSSASGRIGRVGQPLGSGHDFV